jgi:serine phosphatase RsbU (regulator of sigma subunit)
VFADEMADLRKQLPTLHGEELMDAYFQLHVMSLDCDDVDQQLAILNEWIGAARKESSEGGEVAALLSRASVFYNNDLNDSIYNHIPQDRNIAKRYEKWKGYYDLWTFLVNTYIYGDKANIGLHEVQQMYDDAVKREDQYGMGMAYSAMGNAYMVLGNLEESANAYQKGLDIFQASETLPVSITEIYPNYGDVLNARKDYARLEKMTEQQWRPVIERFMREHQLGKDDNRSMTYWSYYHIACAQAKLGMGKLDEAETHLNDTKKILVSEEDYIGQKYLFYLAQLRMQQGRYEEALQLNTRRMQLMDATDDKSVLISVRQQRAELMEHLGLFSEAAKIYHEMYSINDSINSFEIKKQLNEMNTLFHVDELKMEQERAQYRNTILVVSIIVVALVIFLFFRIRSALRLKAAHQKLEAAHDKLEQTHKDLLEAYDNLEETTAAKERIESDLRIARDIQMSMVPQQFPERPDIDLFASMTPAKEVGGDLYDFLLMDDKLYFALGDVSGKGVPASLFMAQATRLFHTLAKLQMPPSEIATRLNDELGADNDQGMFVTMFLGVIDIPTGHLAFCNAGHNPPVLVHDAESAEATCEFLEMIPNAPIGLWPGLDYEGEEIADIRHKPLFIYTDGLNEAENCQHDQFTDERLLDILAHTPFETSQQTIELLRSEVEKHRDGAEPNDDLTMLCINIKTNN